MTAAFSNFLHNVVVCIGRYQMGSIVFNSDSKCMCISLYFAYVKKHVHLD
jgi:hypothetical protein